MAKRVDYEKMTREETMDAVRDGLDMLDEPSALDVIKAWAQANGLAEDLGFEGE